MLRFGIGFMHSTFAKPAQRPQRYASAEPFPTTQLRFKVGDNLVEIIPHLLRFLRGNKLTGKRSLINTVSKLNGTVASQRASVFTAR